MDEEQKKETVVDRINSLYNSAQNLRALSGFIKKAQVLQKAAALLATSEVWGPIAAAIGGVVVFTIIIVVATGGQAKGTEPPRSAGRSPVPLVCATAETSPEACLKKNFNIEVAADANFSKEELQDIHNAFSLVYSYPKFKNSWNKGNRTLFLLTEPPFHANEEGVPGTCTGEARTASDLKKPFDQLLLWNMSKCSFYGGNAYLIIHEAGHILADRDGELYIRFDSKSLYDKDGVSCYKFYSPQETRPGGYYLRTYIGPGSFINEENFAEGIADYVLYQTWKPVRGGVVHSLNFPKDCQDTFGWFNEYLFGN